MDIRRIALYAALALVVYSLWTDWQKDYPPATASVVQGKSNTAISDGSLLPELPAKGSVTVSNENPSPAILEAADNSDKKTSKAIHVTTDVLSLMIDSRHGDIVQAQLLDYPVSADEQNQPVTLLFDKPQHRYVANSSLFVNSDNKIRNVDFNYSSASKEYQLSSGQDQLKLVLKGKSPAGLMVSKTYTFSRGSYLIRLDYDLKNSDDTAWNGYMNTQLLRSTPEESSSSLFQVGSYTGASYSSPGQHRYQKVSFKEMTKNNLNVDATGGWVAMQQHYFLSAWIPDAESKNVLYTRAVDSEYTIGTVSQAITVEPGNSAHVGSSLYLGPETTSVLKGIAPGLDLTVDYGWLWFLSSALFSLLKAIHSVVGNWGWSIVLVTMLIKLAFYRLSAASYKSMAGMRKLQPKLQALRERLGDDKAKISQATMELYRQEKVNPLGGCLPIIIQIPVFIALYWVLLESVELRQAPFMFWVKDLAAADPFHVLPIIMGGTMLIQQRLNPAPPDPMQAKVMMFLPILFTALFWNFPSGLVLYWIVNNTLSILQQWHITRKYSVDVQPKSSKQPISVK